MQSTSLARSRGPSTARPGEPGAPLRMTTNVDAQFPECWSRAERDSLPKATPTGAAAVASNPGIPFTLP